MRNVVQRVELSATLGVRLLLDLVAHEWTPISLELPVVQPVIAPGFIERAPLWVGNFASPSTILNSRLLRGPSVHGRRWHATIGLQRIPPRFVQSRSIAF